jgi:hypothetical protein
VVVALCATSSLANIVTVNFSAEVTYVNTGSGLSPDQIGAADVITGSYSYDTDAPDLNLLPTIGDYRYCSPPCGITFSVGDLVFQSDPRNLDFRIQVFNNYLGYDRYCLTSYNNVPLSEQLHPTCISCILQDTSGTALLSDALPATPPVLNDWQSTDSLRIIIGDSCCPHLRADITHVDAMPEAATALLLGLGALTLTRKRRPQLP